MVRKPARRYLQTACITAKGRYVYSYIPTFANLCLFGRLRQQDRTLNEIIFPSLRFYFSFVEVVPSPNRGYVRVRAESLPYARSSLPTLKFPGDPSIMIPTRQSLFNPKCSPVFRIAYCLHREPFKSAYIY